MLTSLSIEDYVLGGKVKGCASYLGGCKGPQQDPVDFIPLFHFVF